MEEVAALGYQAVLCCAALRCCCDALRCCCDALRCAGVGTVIPCGSTAEAGSQTRSPPSLYSTVPTALAYGPMTPESYGIWPYS